jgi:diguanylate cyclase (GGDEF)-like protein
MQPGLETDPSEGSSELPAIVAIGTDILSMLRVRESDLLPTWLCDRLSTAYTGMRSRVLRVYPARAARIKDLPDFEAYSVGELAAHEAPKAIGLDEALLDAIRSRRPLSISQGDGMTRLLVVLEAAGDVRYVVELVGKRPPVAVIGSLECFAAVASKYFERLVDAETDPLTRLSNRRAFHSHIDAGLRQWSESGRPHYFAMLDIDHFKRVNDDFGHLYGDEILVHFANLMRRTFRAGDRMYRFGGEEFVLIYDAEPGIGGEIVLERFRSAMEAYAFPGIGRVTVSIGFAQIADSSTPAAILIDRADQAVYYAKEHGRNRVCGWEALVTLGELGEQVSANKDVTLF